MFYRLDVAKCRSRGKYIVAIDNDRDTKWYLTYNTIEDIEKAGDKHHYEIINGPQRIYFDIDAKLEDNDIKDFDIFIEDFVKHIKKMYKTEVNIYESNTKVKLSYHIILCNIATMDNTQCKARAQEIIDAFDHPYKKYIDMKVYRINQLLRMLGNSKINKDNTKKIYKCFDSSFKGSLVSNIDDAVMLKDLDAKYLILPPRLQIEKYK